jgi:uncharacterized protein YndB with AHSA1/START domain
MDVSYNGKEKNYIYYRCRGEHGYGAKQCWSLTATPLDQAIEDLFLQSMVPAELEVSLAVEREVTQQSEALDRHWKLRFEQARYEAQRAERRYKSVDPDNRVVARTLEREWEERLEQLQQIEQQREEARRTHTIQLTAEDRARIRSLARDLPKVWRAKTTKLSERKAMLRMAIEAISVAPVDVPKRMTHVRVAWKSGAVTDLCVERPEHGRMTPRAAAARVRELCARRLHDAEVANQLNAEGLRTGANRPWTAGAVARVRSRESIPRTALPVRTEPTPDRDAQGRFSVAGAARYFGVSMHVIRGWVYAGRVKAQRESYGAHHDVLWLTINRTNERQLRSHLEQTANRYPRIVPPPPTQTEVTDTEKFVS